MGRREVGRKGVREKERRERERKKKRGEREDWESNPWPFGVQADALTLSHAGQGWLGVFRSTHVRPANR